jgi:signal transduction histidine kinase
MELALKKARKQFTLVTVGVAISCAALATLGTYFYAEQRLQQNISAAKLGQLAADNTELSAYIASQEPYHAHFETIASIIQKEDRSQLTASLPVLLGGVFIVSGLVGWWISRKLLVPVRESYIAQRRFMQDAAHELRNPLAAMSTLTQQAQNRPPTGKKLSTFINSIDRQAKQLSAITTDLLLLEHREYPGTQKVNISELLEDVIEELHHQTIDKNIRINMQVPSELVAQIDPQHFVYIAKNMVENAIKFSKPKKQVDIQLKQKKSGWELQVRDYGIGIPKEEIPHITGRFYRAKNASETDGTGLGMAIIAKFVDVYKGNLQIKSTTGKGTTISVSM